MIASNSETKRRIAWRTGVGLALLTSFLTIWTTIVRDDGHGAGFFLIIMAAGVSAFAARFEPVGVARAMLGVAVMQMVWGVALATAPVIANTPNGSMLALVSNAFFAALWLGAAACFRAAGRSAASPAGC